MCSQRRVLILRPGFSGAQLANMVNEAALLAAKSHAAHLDAAGLETAQVQLLLAPGSMC